MSLIYTAEPAATSSSSTTSKRNSLYLGSKSDAKDRSKLERLGITHILNVTPEKEAGIKSGVANYFEKTKKFTYRRIPIYDNATSDLIQYAPCIISFISNALHYGSVLVHCQRGVSRSTSCVLIYLMNKVGSSLESSMALVKRRRPCADPIPAFVEQLKRYECECRDLGLIKDGIDGAKSNQIGDDGLSGEEGGDNSSKKRKLETQGKRIQGPARPIGPACPIGPARPIGPSLPPSRGDSCKGDK